MYLKLQKELEKYEEFKTFHLPLTFHLPAFSISSYAFNWGCSLYHLQPYFFFFIFHEISSSSSLKILASIISKSLVKFFFFSIAFLLVYVVFTCFLTLVAQPLAPPSPWLPPPPPEPASTTSSTAPSHWPCTHVTNPTISTQTSPICTIANHLCLHHFQPPVGRHLLHLHHPWMTWNPLPHHPTAHYSDGRTMLACGRTHMLHRIHGSCIVVLVPCTYLSTILCSIIFPC